MTRRNRLASTLLALVAAFYVAPACAQKSVEMIVSEAVGGGSDTMARLVARNLGRHLPGKPTIVARNMPGAGGLSGTNYLFNVAPKDGSVIEIGRAHV